MSPLEFLVAALATWHTVEVWHEGSIFAGWRAYMEVQDTFLSRLLGCPFCLSLWVGGFWAAWLLACNFYLPAYVAWPAYGLAVARLSNLGNDYFHDHCRTPSPADELNIVLDDLPEFTEHDDEPEGNTETD